MFVGLPQSPATAGKGRTCAGHPPLALDRGQEGCLLTADKGARSFLDLQVKTEGGAQDVVPDQAQSPPPAMAIFRCWTARGYSART